MIKSNKRISKKELKKIEYLEDYIKFYNKSLLKILKENKEFIKRVINKI